jgi:hypothetical protein
MKRTIKISEEAYQALSHQSEKEGKTKEEMATSIISAALGAEQNRSTGEQYDPKTGKRIFRR